MNDLIPIFEWSIMSSIIICIIMVLRWILGSSIRKTWQYGLWAIVVIRLLVPVLPSSTVSIFSMLERESFKIQAPNTTILGAVQENILADEKVLPKESIYLDKIEQIPTEEILSEKLVQEEAIAKESPAFQQFILVILNGTC